MMAMALLAAFLAASFVAFGIALAMNLLCERCERR